MIASCTSVQLSSIFLFAHYIPKCSVCFKIHHDSSNCISIVSMGQPNNDMPSCQVMVLFFKQLTMYVGMLDGSPLGSVPF